MCCVFLYLKTHIFHLRMLQQAFIDMENMFEMLAEKQDVSIHDLDGLINVM